jgi:hypothetical protein
MKRNLIITLLLFLPLITFAQNAERIVWKGVLKNSNDSTPIAYAHIGMPAAGIGTITNIEGRFGFLFYARKGDTIQISHLGYETLKLAVGKGNWLQDSVFYLTPKKYELAQLNVLPEGELKKILQEAAQHIKKNYPRKLHYSTAFYRELMRSRDTDSLTRLNEAIMGIQDRGYRTSVDNIKVEIFAQRKSNDFTNRDIPLKLKLFFNMMEKVIDDYTLFPSEFFRMLRMDPIRNYAVQKRNDDSGQFWGRNLLDIAINVADLQLLGIYEKETNPEYKIAYRYRGVMLFEGEITIRLKDYAILQFTMRGMFKDNKIKYRRKVVYQKDNDFYYPIFYEFVNPEIKSVDGFRQQILVFLSHSSDRKNIDKIKRRNQVAGNEDIYEHEAPYEEAYWDTLNILKREPLTPEMIQDLSATQPLPDQFRENGQTNP